MAPPGDSIAGTAMRILHTADWRLGRAFHGTDLLGEQAAVLEQLAALVREHGVHAVFVAGGLLEPGAGPEAVELLDHALGRLALDEGAAVVALAGRLAPPVGAGVLARAGVHLLGEDRPAERALELADEHGPVAVHALSDAGGWEGFAGGLERARSGAGERRVLLARVPEGEDGGRLGPKAWSDFAACLLGGRRRPREVVPGRAWQAGALTPPDFESAGAGEAELGLIELAADGAVERRALRLDAPRGLAVREGRLAELLALEGSKQRLRAVVTDEGPVEGLERLRERWPALLEIERPEPSGTGPTLEEAFAAWCERVEGEPLSERDRRLLADAMAGGSA